MAFRSHRQARALTVVQAVNGVLTGGRGLVAGWVTAIAALALAPARGLTGAAKGRGAAPAGPPVTGPRPAGPRPGGPRPAGPRPAADEVRALVAGARSRWIDLDGPVHYLDFGGPASGPAMVAVHGLAGSAVNWSAIAPLLAGRCRLLAPDLPGHGLTRSLGRGTDVAALRALLHRFIETVPAGPVILIGNSMGGMISLLEASAAPAAVAGLVLVDPVLPLVPALPDRFVTPMLAAYATPGLGPLLMRLRRRMPPEALVASVLSLCCVDASRVPAIVLAQHVSVARQALMSPEAEREIAVSARSMIATFADLRGGEYRRAIRSITCPVLLLHGARDRMVPITVARAAARANPAWTLIEMPGVGHIPQLEAPADTSSAITNWLTSAGQPAATAASPASPARPA
jgi:pimeloyl-ACP methyl ester carboxylesterase